MSKEFRYIVRFEGTDLDGNLTIHQGLSRIKGVGQRLAFAVLNAAKIDPLTRVGFMPEDDFNKIKSILNNPLENGIPRWLLNRQKDYATGQDLHIIGSNLFLANKGDIDREKKLRTWRGVRHQLGLKVRGQRTKTTGRSGRTVGVSRKKVRK
ncbi:MAG: 30S ribosomal protein S13 [Candidatus Ranarchaeia archaeon]